MAPAARPRVFFVILVAARASKNIEIDDGRASAMLIDTSFHCNASHVMVANKQNMQTVATATMGAIFHMQATHGTIDQCQLCCQSTLGKCVTLRGPANLAAMARVLAAKLTSTGS